MLRDFIWDFDGTLYDTYPAMAGAMTEALHKRGVYDDISIVNSYMKISVPDCIAHYSELVNIDDEFMEEYLSRRKELENTICFPYEGIVELLRDITKAGMRNFMFTHRGATVHGLLEKAGMDVYFEDLVTAENGFPRKPEPDAIEYLVEKYGLDKETTAMVGDRAVDIDAGLNAGVKTIAYCDGTGYPIDNADHLVTTIPEMRKLILG